MSAPDHLWPPLIIAEHVPRVVKWRDRALTLAAWGVFVLLLAIELREEKAPDVVRLGIEEGVLLNATGPTTIRMAPPLTLSAAEAEEAIDKFRRALDRVDTSGS